MSRKKNKTNSRSGELNKQSLKKQILSILNQNQNQAFNYKQISKQLSIEDDNIRRLVVDVLYELKNNEDVEELETGKFRILQKSGFITGTIEMTSSNNAFVKSSDLGEPVFISQKNMNHALNGDVVKVYLYAKRKTRHVEGEVVEIIERTRKTFVGIIEISKNFAFLVPETKNIPYDIFIPLDKLNNATNGQKAIARITDWPMDFKNPFGEIIEVIGTPGQNETEIHAILAEYELPFRFPEEVDAAAAQISEKITDDEIKKRRDFRSISTLTIDPADAKDFDDALSYRKLDNGNTEVGVHIADVTHFVPANSILEKEAYERATSVYLVDRVVPMFPEKISNHICSLRPNEDKLCFSVVFELNDEAQILSVWFGKTVIHSIRRFNYDEVQDILETGTGDLSDILIPLNQLAQKMRKERQKKGAIDFDREEVKFVIDPNGKPLSVFFKQNKDSNKLVEEFMLLANKNVAEYVHKNKDSKHAKTFVYRIHDKPNEEKLESFSNFIKKFGYKIQLGSTKRLASSINSVLDDVKGKGEQNVIENLALRAMAKAVYSTKNIGHYGLAFEYYTHFTSPIRRYPDVMVHRLLYDYMNGGESQNLQKYEENCKHSSEKERKAVEAERASIKYKQVEFMSGKIGQPFDGVISGVTEWGIYVELIENKCEGMVPIRDMKGDYYIFDEDNYCLVGKRTKKKYQLGSPVKIEIVRANIVKRQLDFKLLEN